MKKLPIFLILIIVVIIGFFLVQYATPKTGSLEIDLLDVHNSFSKVNIYLMEIESDIIVQKIEGINTPNTITLTDIPPGVYMISSNSHNYAFRMTPNCCYDYNNEICSNLPSDHKCSNAPIVRVTIGKTTKITLKAEGLLYI